MELFNQNNDNDALLKQYEFYNRTKERIEERRQNTNSFIITSLTGLLAFVGISKANSIIISPYMILIVAAAGMTYCYLWYRMMKSFRIKSRVKYKLLQEIEKKLPVNLFAVEWDMLSMEEEDNKKFRTARVESYIPWVFFILFALVFIINLIR